MCSRRTSTLFAKQLNGADSNTIVVVPEWQTKPDTRSSPTDAKFHEPQFFRKMLTEIMSKTPPLHNLKIDKHFQHRRHYSFWWLQSRNV